MTRYQIGFVTAIEGLPCARPGDAEFSAGWCDAIYVLTEDGQLQESGEFDDMYAECQDLDDIGRSESLQPYLY